MKAALPLALLLLAGCDRNPRSADDSAGARLERAALAAELVADPARISPVGAWARDTDRVCIVPGDAATLRIGVMVDYGEGQGCAASGIARRRGEAVAVAFGPCRFDAQIAGDRIAFPAELPSACDALCTGRGSLSALSVERVSASASEAAQLRTPAGRPLCGS